MTPQEHFTLLDEVYDLRARVTTLIEQRDQLVAQNAELAAANERLSVDRAQTQRAAQGLVTFGSVDAYHQEMQHLRAQRARLDGDNA